MPSPIGRALLLRRPRSIEIQDWLRGRPDTMPAQRLADFSDLGTRAVVKRRPVSIDTTFFTFSRLSEVAPSSLYSSIGWLFINPANAGRVMPSASRRVSSCQQLGWAPQRPCARLPPHVWLRRGD